MKLSESELQTIVGGKRKSTYLQKCSKAGYYIGKATSKIIGWLF